MKIFIVLIALSFSSMALATEFFAQIEEVDCKIVNGMVTRTATFGKEARASYTETKSVKLEGLAPFIEKAIATASETPISGNVTDITFSMKHEDKMYYLDVDQAREVQYLIRMIARICR